MRDVRARPLADFIQTGFHVAFMKAKRFGPDVGTHARTAIGVAHLPLNFPVVIAAELAVR
ncbi:hypothetical protein [Bradyrhizobium sp. NAS96.2]|uniref:hypothetical protein n=1 Tax=Bradyrhizobium sp. NAS96.2 TaxID=1680160 RepID=UPI00095B4EBA|nr:hypothetical protein [Bradyrhizobium sp. NAS96.2]OKO82128.1 hypothetical protein AC628_05145 [Bradyrhizobium sp. NAS96.2]